MKRLKIAIKNAVQFDTMSGATADRLLKLIEEIEKEQKNNLGEGIIMRPASEYKKHTKPVKIKNEK